MTSPKSSLHARLRLCVGLGVAALLVVTAPRIVDAQGLVKGVEQGAKEGNKAAGPVGGVLGGAIGGVVGVVGGVVGAVTGNNGKPANDKSGQPAAGPNDKQGNTKAAKGAKGATKEAKAVQVLTQNGARNLPQSRSSQTATPISSGSRTS
jgi:hypothetical protein